MECMRYVGIDYGEKRIGVAAADGETGIAVPRGVILRENDAQAIKETTSFIMREQIGRIIIGLPLGHDGAETDMSRAARAFGDTLGAAVGLPVEFENEIFTTRMAAHEGVPKDSLDSSSAAIILQSYLDKQKKE